MAEIEIGVLALQCLDRRNRIHGGRVFGDMVDTFEVC